MIYATEWFAAYRAAGARERRAGEVPDAARRLFSDEGSFAALRLVDSKTTTTGVIIATYLPA
jgi:hypothetical protein